MFHGTRYNYGSVFGVSDLQIHIASYLPLSTLLSSFVCCNNNWNRAWKTDLFDKELKNNFCCEYGPNTLSVLGYEWFTHNDTSNDNRIQNDNGNDNSNDNGNDNSNDDKGDYIVIKPIGNETPIPVHSDKKPLDAIKDVQITNNRDMIRYILTNWIFVNKNNPQCRGGLVCGSRFVDIYIDFLRSTCNGNFVCHWASRVCANLHYMYILSPKWYLWKWIISIVISICM